ncbi:MAG: hypothetical protein WC238_00310 [Parcubacteria group bacterium]|jgi:hypothetical protein
MFGESKNIIPLGKGLELQEKKEQQNVESIRAGIANLQDGKEKFEEWQRIALEHGDEQNALLYEVEALENEMLIMEGEILCSESDIMQIERWQQHFSHVMDVDSKREAEERIDDIDSELEFISDYLDSLLEDVNADEIKKQKIQELLKKKERLEVERLNYSK